MNQNETGGPAFPFPGSLYPDGSTCEPGELGMSLRDYFAAKAMQGQLSRPNAAYLSEKEVANVAYMVADAMLKERNK
jgi:hypothetical protein